MIFKFRKVCLCFYIEIGAYFDSHIFLEKFVLEIIRSL
jgi:hypothetical protein